jgi:hypothetical protein
VDLYELIARSYCQDAADAYRAYSPSDADLRLLAEKAGSVLAAMKLALASC